jgi:urease accessory protein
MYSYSQGMECAVQDAWLRNGTDVHDWLAGILNQSQAKVDAPILARLYDAWAQADTQQVCYWSQNLLASRESAELRNEDRQTGQALARLLNQLDLVEAQVWQRHPETTLATLFSLAAVRWHINKTEMLTGYLWSWLENQVLCAVKLIPLGQVAGQQLLKKLAEQIPAVVAQALTLPDAQMGGSAFGLALSSSRHEMQYSRLFRS